jgi:hypothetical protein
MSPEADLIPPHEPLPVQRRQVEAMAAYGIPPKEIARVIGIDADTLRSRFADELDHGHVKANVRVAENLYRKATGDGREAVTAAIFWLKTRAGWRETTNHELSGRNGEPITIITGVPRAEMSYVSGRAIEVRADDGLTLKAARIHDP